MLRSDFIFFYDKFDFELKLQIIQLEFIGSLKGFFYTSSNHKYYTYVNEKSLVWKLNPRNKKKIQRKQFLT